jgi:mandelamide amidase
LEFFKTSTMLSATTPAQAGHTPATANLTSVASALAWLSESPGRALALTEQLLQRADAAGEHNIYLHIAHAQGLTRAQQLDRHRDMASIQVLRGLPIVVKDNIDVAGMPTRSGSPAVHHAATKSASAVARLEQAGAVVLGKTNLHELCFGITSNNAHFGPVRNPYAPAHIAGGSSGGTAAAIAAGLAPAGIGSDTGGSLRIPAALCGVVGFRPTTGRWPADGVLKISDTRDTLGPMGRTVADCAMLDAVVCAQPAPLQDIDLRGLRLGLPNHLFWESLNPDVGLTAHAVLDKLRAAGVVIVPCNLGIDAAACEGAAMTVTVYECLPSLQAYLNGHGQPCDAQKIAAQIASPDVRGIFEHVLTPGVRDEAAYMLARDVDRPGIRAAYAKCFQDNAIDALIFPTTPLAAAPIGQDETVTLCGQQLSTFAAYTRNMAPGSFAGQPGISIPMGLNADGLPLGIALDGPVGDDRRFLAIAQAIQNLIGLIPPPRNSHQETTA